MLVNRLFSWAEKSLEPLQTYATGLLAAAMEVQEIAVMFRYLNSIIFHFRCNYRDKGGNEMVEHHFLVFPAERFCLERLLLHLRRSIS